MRQRTGRRQGEREDGTLGGTPHQSEVAPLPTHQLARDGKTEPRPAAPGRSLEGDEEVLQRLWWQARPVIGDLDLDAGIRLDSADLHRIGPHLQRILAEIAQDAIDLAPIVQFLKVVKHLNRPWPLLAYGQFTPRRPRDWLYNRIALNRYRLFGKREQCLLPTSALAARFLESR